MTPSRSATVRAYQMFWVPRAVILQEPGDTPNRRSARIKVNWSQVVGRVPSVSRRTELALYPTTALRRARLRCEASTAIRLQGRLATLGSSLAGRRNRHERHHHSVFF